MAILDRNDLKGLFIILAVIYLFDSYPGGFLITGIIVFIIMVAVALQSDKLNDILRDSRYAEIIIRVGIAATVIGVLLANAFVVAFGFLASMLLLLMPLQSVNVDLLHWAKVTTNEKRTATSSTKKPAGKS